MDLSMLFFPWHDLDDSVCQVLRYPQLLQHWYSLISASNAASIELKKQNKEKSNTTHQKSKKSKTFLTNYMRPQKIWVLIQKNQNVCPASIELFVIRTSEGSTRCMHKEQEKK